MTALAIPSSLKAGDASGTPAPAGLGHKSHRCNTFRSSPLPVQQLIHIMQKVAQSVEECCKV